MIHARRTLVRLYTFPGLQQDVGPADTVIQGMEPSPRRPLGPHPQTALKLSHFVSRRTPEGVVGSGPAAHALALTSTAATTTAGTLPSRPVVRRNHHRYYDPLGLPLDGARFHHRLIRTTLPRRGRPRRVSPVPCRSLETCRSQYPGEVQLALRSRPTECCLRRDMSGSALPLFLFRGCRIHFMLRPAFLLPP